YLWSTGDTTQNVEVSEAGQYSVQVESGVSGNLYSADFGTQATCGLAGNTWVDCGEVLESNGSFSVGGWLYTNGCDYTTIVSQRPGGSCTDPYYGPGPYNGFHLSYENAGQFEFRLHQNSNGSNPIEPFVTTPAIEEAWVHLVGVFESGQSVKLYLNGTHVDSQPTSIEALEFCDYPFLIGSLQHGGNWSWDGKLDDVFAYSRALSDVEVLSVYESSFPSDGLSGLWQFEEGEGSVAYDASGNGNHGAVTGATWSTDVPYSADNWTLHHVENFDGEIGLEWNTAESITYGGNGVLGKFGENAQVLGTFSGLPTHTQIEVGFDLYVIDSWDGNYGGVDGPDQWFFEIDQQQLIATTFANNPNANNNGGQSYPADGITTFNPIQTGASLLLPSAEGPDCCDCGYHTSVYHINKIVNHNSDSVTLHFSDSLSQSICDESWAIDNVNIRFKNSPTCWLSDSILVDFLSPGCIDDYACNYDTTAQCDDGSCDYSCCPGPGCCDQGLTWNWELSLCQDLNPADINLDGCVQLNDLLDLLSAYGDCGGEESAWQCGNPLEYQGYDYETVQIGEQCWVAENLRTENYKNGDFIPANLDNSEWTSTTSGATVFYGDDVFSLQAYGRLYNWHAVDDARSLCPNAWRIPSDGDWTVLTDFLGGSATAGAQMKTTDGWNGDGDGANSSGFSGVPGGSRASNGNFYLAGSSGYWWSATPYGSSAWYRTVSYNDDSVNRNFAYHRNGYSVRCVQDAQ
ncbi:MAG: FISUMP domain-containing protein, partial [Bacteroidota bacterium]|nr:FISUMP domain-containing protein [Bacteroidota bacterium]